MTAHGLGPNGAMLYCLEYLEANLDWLDTELDRALTALETAAAGAGPDGGDDDDDEMDPVTGGRKDKRKWRRDEMYVVFDTPGQVELSTNHDSLKHILEHLRKRAGFRVRSFFSSACPQPFYSHHSSTRTASRRAPHGRVAHSRRPKIRRRPPPRPAHHAPARASARQRPQQSRLARTGGRSACASASRRGLSLRQPPSADLQESVALRTAFNLDYYTEVQDLSYLLPFLERDQRTQRFGELNRVICDLVEEFGLVGFETLAVEVRRGFRLAAVVCTRPMRTT